MQLKLNSRVLFSLMAFLNKIPKEKLGDIKGNRFKAVTMRRKIVQSIQENLKEYTKTLDDMVKIFNDSQKSVMAFRKEQDEIADKPEKDKLKEINDYAKDENDKLQKKLDEYGKILFYAEKDDKGVERPVLSLDDESEVEQELTDDQVEFLKKKIEEVGVDYFHFEDDLVVVAKEIGLEI